ncbi:hypothetical protein QA641_06060 [Bradyrhizobium sp. CB1650]|uniref:hypothetical protein n=1 Tax=Bradyrhizobium sp. CB1650 TaxID=3039153 RepID=UPI00243565CB|nr:hypothetical protein [Bradyrhizobium sp. CB1650]WGD53479.1 hypothetical protein QA641_06060 [Bradyrhizobium sp. CB1650]
MAADAAWFDAARGEAIYVGNAFCERVSEWPTVNELMQLTRDELCDLAGRIEGTLSSFERGTAERVNALTSLDNIRRVMVRRGLHY